MPARGPAPRAEWRRNLPDGALSWWSGSAAEQRDVVAAEVVVADRVDQAAITAYDSYAPTEALAGRYFAWQTERVLSLIGDRVSVFMDVPTYRSPTPWAENLSTALRGVRQGVERLRRRPRRPFGVALYAEWTTGYHDWDTYRIGWRDSWR